MISQKTIELEKILKETFVPILDWKNTDWDMARKEFEIPLADLPLPEGVTVSRDTLGGIEVERIKIPNDSGKVLFHIHGGGMTLGSCSSGRFMLSHVGVLSGRNTVSVNYRLCADILHRCGLMNFFAPIDHHLF